MYNPRRRWEGKVSWCFEDGVLLGWLGVRLDVWVMAGKAQRGLHNTGIISEGFAGIGLG